MSRLRSNHHYDFTPEQEQAIGQLVTDYWNSNIQTGFGLTERVPHIWFQHGPSLPVQRFEIHPDGTVTKDGVEISMGENSIPTPTG